MPFAHYTDNPTDFTEHTLDGNQVTVDNWTYPTAHSRSMNPFGFLAEQASLAGYQPHAQVVDTTSINFASVQGDSELSSMGSSSFTCSMTDYVSTTISASDSTQHAPRNWSRHQVHKRRFSSGERWSSRERPVARDLRRYYKHKSPEALQQQERQHEKQMAQQQWEAEQRLRVEALRLAAQTSTQLNAEFRVMEYDSSAEMEKRIRMQRVRQVKLRRPLMLRNIFAHEAGEALRRRENA